MLVRNVLLITFFLLMVTVFPIFAKAAPDFSGCDINITNSGTTYTINQNNTVYCLNESINLNDSNGVNFNAGVQNTTLDCLGYNIDSNYSIDTYGVYLDGSSTSNSTVKNCNITDFLFGINLEFSSNNTFINNTFNNNSYGINLASSSNNTITNNIANSNWYGIYIDSSSNNNTITNNIANSNWYGIYLNSSSNNNTITNNIANSNWYGIYLNSSSNNTIVNNTITNNTAGIYIESSPNNALINNIINNSTVGFYIDSSPNNTLTNNTIQVSHNSSSNQQGLEVTGYSVSDFINNINSGNAINGLPIYYIDSISRSCTNNAVYTNGSSYSYMGFVNCNNITVSDSSPTDSVVFVGLTNSSINNINISYSFSSFYFFNTSFSNITNCIVNNNWYGIFLSHSNNNTLTNNTANNNNVVYGGISLYNNSNNNTLTNNIANSNWYGIYILNSSSNSIKGGSIWNNTYDYYLDYSGATNSFNNTNFTSSRSIYFNDVGSWFNYANDTSGLLLKTNNINANTLRTLNSWSTTNISWNESGYYYYPDTANYTIYGLTANTLYAVSNNSVNRYTINSSSCGCINFTIDLTYSSQTIQVTNDATPPTWSSNITNNPPAYSSSQPTWMNITWNDNVAVNSVLIESNYSGTKTNYTPSQDGNVYYINPILGAGSYYWKSYGKDTSNNWNASANRTFTIIKGTLTGSVTGSSVTYPTSVNMIASESNSGDADVNYTFWRNGALISSANGTNPTADTSQIAAGTYTYLLNSSGGANWTANSNISTLSITVSAASSSTTGGSSIGGITTTGMTTYVNLAVGKANITANYIITSGKLIANIAKYQDVAIRGMNITVVKNVANIKIMISKLLSLPSNVPYDINCKVYNYVSVDKLNFTDADIKSVNITFAVNKTWLTNNNVDASNITMYRWANNKWNDLNAVKVSDDGKEVFFAASSPGLSVLVIGTKGGAAVVTPPPTTTTNCIESWSCTAWSSCAASQQTRTCTDSNSCGTSASKPAESQTCQVAAAETTAQPFSLFQVSAVIIVAIVIVVLVILEFTGKLHLSNIRKNISSRMRTENSSKPPENVKYYYSKKDMEDDEESK